MRVPKTMMPFAVALVLASLAACDKRDEPSTTRTTSAGDKPAFVATPTQTQLTTTDRDFITKVTQENMLEVSQAKKAAESATNVDVKAFAERMLTEHTKAGEELKTLAQIKGVNPPIQLDSDHQSKLDSFAKLTGTKVDKKFASEMVSDHDDDIKSFKKATTDLKDPDLQAWAAKMVPILEGHLAAAKDIEQKAKALR